MCMRWSSKEKKKSWQGLIQLFLEAKSKERMEELLDLFLTLSEKEALSDRYRIVQALLTTSFPQREIAEKLKVSIGKITSGSNELKRHSDQIKNFLSDKMS